MAENKEGDYEPKIKFICLNCKSPNILPYETTDTTALKIGIKMIVNAEMTQPSSEILYHCKDCNAFSQYPILHYKNNNQISTTKLNNLQLDII
jgi:hypothetical protein